MLSYLFYSYCIYKLRPFQLPNLCGEAERTNANALETRVQVRLITYNGYYNSQDIVFKKAIRFKGGDLNPGLQC